MIRQAGLADAPAIARVEVETWRATYAGILADEVLLSMSRPRQTRLWEYEIRQGPVWVWDEGGVAGFCNGGRQRNPLLPYDGEVYTLYVHPDAQGRGVGRNLMAAVFADLVERGRMSVLLWVLRDNPSRFFYERLGGRLAVTRHIPVGGRPVPALGYGWAEAASVSFAADQPRK